LQLEGQIVGTVAGGMVTIHCSGPTFFGFIHIEDIIMGAGEEIDEVAGGAIGMGVDRIDEVGDRTSEEHAAGVYGAGFTAGSLARKGVRGPGFKVSSGKELTEVGRMTENY
jgi:hypothetical protein